MFQTHVSGSVFVLKCHEFRRQDVKELKVRPGTDVHDYEVRLRAAVKFLKKVSYLLPGYLLPGCLAQELTGNFNQRTKP